MSSTGSRVQSHAKLVQLWIRAKSRHSVSEGARYVEQIWQIGDQQASIKGSSADGQEALECCMAELVIPWRLIER